MYGCTTGVQDSIIAAAVVAVFVALVWRPRKRSLSARKGQTELTPGIARQIKDRVRLDWIEPRLQRAVVGALMVVPIRPSADLVEFDRHDPPIKRMIPDIDELLTETNGRLLVAGGPGSGKSGNATEIAKVLAQRSDLDDKARIPVVLSVSSWNRQLHADIPTWVGMTMERLYQYLPWRNGRLPRPSNADWCDAAKWTGLAVPPPSDSGLPRPDR